MALRLYSLRFQRVLSSISNLNRSLLPTTISSSSPTPVFSSLPWSPAAPTAQSRLFRASASWMLSSRSSFKNNFDDIDKIDPDTILFEGCDFNHWLITMDFPKDPKPTPEEMVRTYEETCAKGLNISIEEAKKRIYACSTTTYQGFQAVMTEAESEQFRGLPGVVFILPDSYIDPQNKEYGGDKYENGVITPRPPPVQYGRPSGKNRDRNRNYDQPRYDGQGGQGQYRQANPQFNQQGSIQRDGRNYGSPQQNHPPQQNYPTQQNYPSQQGYAQQQHFTPQQNYAPPMQGMPMNNRDYAPGGREPYQGNFNPGQQNNYYNQERRNMPQSDRWNYQPPAQNDFTGENRNYAPGPTGQYGQGPPGYQNQGNFGEYGQGMDSNYGQGDMGYAGGQGFPQADQRNMQGDQRSNGPMGHMGANQGR